MKKLIPTLVFILTTQNFMADDKVCQPRNRQEKRILMKNKH